MEQALYTRPRRFLSFTVQAWTSGPGAERRGAGAGVWGWGGGEEGVGKPGCHSDTGSVLLPYQHYGSWFVRFLQNSFRCGSLFVYFYHRQKTLSNVVHGLSSFTPVRKLSNVVHGLSSFTPSENFPLCFMVCHFYPRQKNSLLS